MSKAESPEARELSLVGKVELKIALPQSDTALQNILKTYLPPLLLKLASDFASVRTKVSARWERTSSSNYSNLTLMGDQIQRSSPSVSTSIRE